MIYIYIWYIYIWYIYIYILFAIFPIESEINEAATSSIWHDLMSKAPWSSEGVMVMIWELIAWPWWCIPWWCWVYPCLLRLEQAKWSSQRQTLGRLEESTLKKRNPVASESCIIFSAHCSSGTRPRQCFFSARMESTWIARMRLPRHSMARQSISEIVSPPWLSDTLTIFHQFLWELWVSWYRYWKGFSIPSAASSPQRKRIFWTNEAGDCYSKPQLWASRAMPCVPLVPTLGLGMSPDPDSFCASEFIPRPVGPKDSVRTLNPSAVTRAKLLIQWLQSSVQS